MFLFLYYLRQTFLCTGILSGQMQTPRGQGIEGSACPASPEATVATAAG